MAEVERLYKFTAEDGGSCHGGTGKWTPGKWRSVSGELVACQRGLHVVRRDQVLQWLAPALWEVETVGDIIDAGDKLVARKARIVRRVEGWNERTARIFAADCAEDALQYATDDIRPTLEVVIYTVRCYADGQATDEDLSAAWSAARLAAESAARSAAESAAWLAARSAARSRYTERFWQLVEGSDG